MDTAQISLICGGGDGARDFLLSSYCSMLFQPPAACTNKPKALAANDGYHVVMMTNTLATRLARLVGIQGSKMKGGIVLGGKG